MLTHVSDHGEVPGSRDEGLVGAVEVGADEGDCAAVTHLCHARDALGRYVGACHRYQEMRDNGHNNTSLGIL